MENNNNVVNVDGTPEAAAAAAVETEVGTPEAAAAVEAEATATEAAAAVETEVEAPEAAAAVEAEAEAAAAVETEVEAPAAAAAVETEVEATEAAAAAEAETQQARKKKARKKGKKSAAKTGIVKIVKPSRQTQEIRFNIGTTWGELLEEANIALKEGWHAMVDGVDIGPDYVLPDGVTITIGNRPVNG